MVSAVSQVYGEVPNITVAAYAPGPDGVARRTVSDVRGRGCLRGAPQFIQSAKASGTSVMRRPLRYC
jgi:hypothetical protein